VLAINCVILELHLFYSSCWYLSLS
jgi:hypothetical protein